MPFPMTLSWPSLEDGLCRRLASPGQSVEGRGFKKKKKKSRHFEIFFRENKLSLFSSSPSPLLVGQGWGWGVEWGQLPSLSLLFPCTSATRMLPVLS